jgi:hypothetical protein
MTIITSPWSTDPGRPVTAQLRAGRVDFGLNLVATVSHECLRPVITRCNSLCLDMGASFGLAAIDTG